jgi:putative phosphoribosyl transferase
MNEGPELWNGEWIRPGSRPGGLEEETLAIPFDGSRSGPGLLDGDLALPEEARGLVVFVHGTGATRRDLRNRFAARVLQLEGFATLLLDLLTPAEAPEDEVSAERRLDVPTLASRLVGATRWMAALPRTRALRLGYFGASTGAAAALVAAAEVPELVAGIVSRGGRTDLVPPETLGRVRAPVLLVVGARDEQVLRLNRSSLQHLPRGELAIVPGAAHLFEEPGALPAVARLAAEWFADRLGEPMAIEARTGGGLTGRAPPP